MRVFITSSRSTLPNSRCWDPDDRLAMGQIRTAVAMQRRFRSGIRGGRRGSQPRQRRAPSSRPSRRTVAAVCISIAR